MQDRMVARKIDIKTLYTGKYIVQEGFNPNYIDVNGERVSRVRVLAAVIDNFLSEDGNYGTITLDDGTDTIRVKAFQDLRIIEPVEKGDTVEVVGKIREYNEERYIQPEIIVKVDDPNYEVLRKLEIKKFIPAAVAANKEEIKVNEEKAEAKEQEKVDEAKSDMSSKEEIEEKTEEPAIEKSVEIQGKSEKPQQKSKPIKTKTLADQKKLI